MAPLPFVVLAHVEQDHRPVERRGNIGDLRLRDVDLIHTANADMASRWRSTARTADRPIEAAPAIPDYPQFPQVHPQAFSGRNPVRAAQSVGLLRVTVDNLGWVA